MASKKRTQSDRNAEIEKQLRESLFDIYRNAWRNHLTFQHVLDSVGALLANEAYGFKKLPQWQQSSLNGYRWALHDMVQLELTEFRYKLADGTVIDCKGNPQNLSPKEVYDLSTHSGSVWKDTEIWYSLHELTK
jgi:uncharacterized protein YnzC (UPF0291/DUF896 family)